MKSTVERLASVELKVDLKGVFDCSFGKAGPNVKPLASLHNSDGASTGTGPVSHKSNTRP